jgi:AmmeMemoRadiSam system protein B
MAAVRKPAVAGTFYPRDPARLRAEIEGHLAAAIPAALASPPRALIGPHAGYVYSGPIAGSAYAAVRPHRDRYRRVVLVGSTHRAPLAGIGVCHDDFSTPLGTARVDQAALARLAEHPAVYDAPEAHRDEHSLEVHIPFLQITLADFTLVPLLVGDASAEEVAEAIDSLGDDPADLIVVSSDLSHYLSYEAARRIDQSTCEAIEHLDPKGIGTDQACGRIPIQALLLLARRRGLKVQTRDLRNSGDTAGPRDQVVGYGAWVFSAPVRI